MEKELINQIDNMMYMISGESTDDCTVYIIHGESQSIKYWNDSNNESFIHSDVLESIKEEYMDGEISGSIYDDFNHICWELV